MAKLESSFKNMFIVLSAIAIIAAAALGSVYKLTAAPIAKAKEEKTQAAIRDVLPPFDKIETATSTEGFIIHKAYKTDAFVGAAVEAVSDKGFGGNITIMVGFDAEGNIVNYAVLEQKETPGLGTKMGEWFKTNKGNQNINGKNPAKNKLTVSKDGGEIDAITAATISSRAFLDAVNKAYKAYEGANSEQDVESGATAQAQKGGTNE